jgi:hypothetical protein
VLRLVASLAIAIGGLASSAHAEDAQQSAAARALFEQGIVLADKSDWKGAADRFERSNELRPSPVVAYNLANAWVELGRLVEASEVLKQIEKDSTAKPQVKKNARSLLLQLEPRIGTLVVSVEAHRAPKEVLVNDRPLPEAAIGVPTPIDPGSVVVTVMDGQNVLWTKRIDVAPGGEQRVTIELPKTQASEPASVVVPVVPTPRETAERASTEPPARRTAPTDSDESDRAFYEEPWVWVGVGVVVVAGVLTGVLLAISSDDDGTQVQMPTNPIGGSRLQPEIIEVEE